MKKISRADFLKGGAALIGAAAVGTVIIPPKAKASGGHGEKDYGKFYGILFDATKCVGCRTCERACNEVNDRPQPDELKITEPDWDDVTKAYEKLRRTGYSSHTVINRFYMTGNDDKGNPIPTYVKYQCMHCNNPACVSACIVGALRKQPDGSVYYDQGDCIGCRYCLQACPFQVPAYEYNDPITPAVLKCTLCEPRIEKGELPACVKACPMEAMTFGNREELLELAHGLIKKYPDRYQERVWGEQVIGGTAWMYLLPKSEKNFADLYKLNFAHLTEEIPPITEDIQHTIFKYFIPPIVFYGALGAIMYRNDKKHKKEIEEARKGGDAHE